MWRYFAHFLPKCWKTLINKKGFFEKVREKINVFMWKEIKVINPRKIEAWGSIKVTGDTWERALWRMVTLEKYGMQNQWSTKEAIGPMVWVYGIHQSFMGNICWKDILVCRKWINSWILAWLPEWKLSSWSNTIAFSYRGWLDNVKKKTCALDPFKRPHF